MYSEAVAEATEAFEVGSSLPEGSGGHEIMAHASWQLGDILRESGQCDKAIDLKEFYDQLKRELPATPPPVAAEVLLLAACEEHQTTRDGKDNGVFTKSLLDVWNTNSSKTYAQLMTGISQNLKQQNIETTPVMVPIPKTSALGEAEAFRI